MELPTTAMTVGDDYTATEPPLKVAPNRSWRNLPIGDLPSHREGFVGLHGAAGGEYWTTCSQLGGEVEGVGSEDRVTTADAKVPNQSIHAGVSDGHEPSQSRSLIDDERRRRDRRLRARNREITLH
jgi:hypothetical protein